MKLVITMPCIGKSISNSPYKINHTIGSMLMNKIYLLFSGNCWFQHKVFLRWFRDPIQVPRLRKKLSRDISEWIVRNFSGPYRVPNIFLKKTVLAHWVISIYAVKLRWYRYHQKFSTLIIKPCLQFKRMAKLMLFTEILIWMKDPFKM